MTVTITPAEQKELDAAIEEAEGQAWADDMAQMRWAEAGGYAAGLARPGRDYPRTDGHTAASCGLDNSIPIPF